MHFGGRLLELLSDFLIYSHINVHIQGYVNIARYRSVVKRDQASCFCTKKIKSIRHKYCHFYIARLRACPFADKNVYCSGTYSEHFDFIALLLPISLCEQKDSDYIKFSIIKYAKLRLLLLNVLCLYSSLHCYIEIKRIHKLKYFLAGKILLTCRYIRISLRIAFNTNCLCNRKRKAAMFNKNIG